MSTSSDADAPRRFADATRVEVHELLREARALKAKAIAKLLCGTMVLTMQPEDKFITEEQLGEIFGKAFALHRTAVLLEFIDRLSSLLMRNVDRESAIRLLNSARFTYARGSEDAARSYTRSVEQILTILEYAS